MKTEPLATAPLAFIIGASSGIGQAPALHYHQAGWRLALVARRADVIKSWANACGASAHSYQIYSADMAVTDSIMAAGQACLVCQGVPEVVFSNAGLSAGIDYLRARRPGHHGAGLCHQQPRPGRPTFYPFITPLTRQNRYVMPFLMAPEDFARKAFAAVQSGARYRVIPWQVGMVAKVLRLLPDALFDRLLAGPAAQAPARLRALKERQGAHSLHRGMRC